MMGLRYRRYDGGAKCFFEMKKRTEIKVEAETAVGVAEARAYIRKFGIAEYVPGFFLRGEIPGVTKASW